MVRNPIDIWFDFVDPASVLLLLEVDAAARNAEPWAIAGRIGWRPLELRPPPSPLVGLDDAEIAPLWKAAEVPARELGVELRPPTLVPWTRKAHELVAHAASRSVEDANRVRLAVARAYALDGHDIGRVDVLVELASGLGLDRTETKAVLDVDRYEAEVSEALSSAARAQVTRTPTIAYGERRLEGFHNRTVLGTLLGT